MTARRRSWRTIAVLLGMVALQVSLAGFSLYVLSGVRAYVAGESLYSKGQKDAQIYLADYAESQREDDYRHLMAALSVPIADRRAREALQLPEPDTAAAYSAFIDGGNHPDDVPMLIRLFRWFGRTPLMSEAIATWTEGDRVIERMRLLVEETHASVRAGRTDAEALRRIRAEAPELNRRLTALESEFSAQLGHASRKTQHVLLALNGLLAVVLAVSGIAFVRRAARVQALSEAEVARREDELRRGQLVMRRLIGEVSDGVITYDDERRILVFNSAAEKMFETPASEALGGALDRLFDGEVPWAALAELGSGALCALTGRRARSGQTFQLEASSSRILTDEGTLHTIVLRDVTAREIARAEREARETLEAANRAKTQFLSRMSHELRTPLNAVIGFAQLLRTDTQDAPTPHQIERIEHIEKAGAHLLALVNDVLDLSRIDSGEMAVSVEAVEIGAAADEAATMVSPLVTRTGIELVVLPWAAEPPGAARKAFAPSRPTSEPVWVRADPVRLRQVLVNLLSNAVKYNRPGGSVTLSWRVEGEACVVSIADTGIGMSSDKLAKLFEPFNRLGAETSKVEGTGIGLVLSRRLAELMGARLEIASTLGSGTLATLRIALLKPGSVRSAEPGPGPEAASRAGSLDLLYAEDNEVNAELVRQIVSMRPAISLRVAQSGADALAMARERAPDVMLVDMNLGDMTGLELARLLRRQASTRGIELVALSADALPEQIRAAMSGGFREYLTKPVDFRKLLALLDARLRGPG